MAPIAIPTPEQMANAVTLEDLYVKLAQAMVHIAKFGRQFDRSSIGLDRLLVQVLTVIRGAQIPVRRCGIRP